MPPADTSQAGSTWLIFTVLTVSCWGLYGIFLHKGQHFMGDPEHGRMKAFLLVGVAYMLVAVLAPVGLLAFRGAVWTFSGPGVMWSLLAGTVGAVGAFGVLLAFGAGGLPAVVMSVIFAGAPIINAAVAITLSGAWGRVRWPFVLGILMAALGGFLVVYFKPPPLPPPAAPSASISGSTSELAPPPAAR